MAALEREDLLRSAWLPQPAGCRVRPGLAPEWVLHPRVVPGSPAGTDELFAVSARPVWM